MIPAACNRCMLKMVSNLFYSISDPMKLFDWLTRNHMADISHILPNVLPPGKLEEFKPYLTDWNSLNDAAKHLRVKKILRQIFPEKEGMNNTKIVHKDELMQDQPRPDFERSFATNSTIKFEISVPVTRNVVTTTIRPNRLSFLPQKGYNFIGLILTIFKLIILNFIVPPYFKVRDEDAATSVITPSGRTIKLQCKAGGQPEPQVLQRQIISDFNFSNFIEINC